MTDFRTQDLKDNPLFFAVRRKIHVPAFTGQAYPAFINMHQMRHAEASSRAIHRNRFAFDRFRAAKLDQMLFFQHGDCHRHGGEIIDDFQMAKAQIFFHLRNRECPGMVGHCHPVAGDRTGNGNATIFDADAMLIQVHAHHGLQTGVIQPGIRFCLRNLAAGNVAQSKTCVGAANITY